MSEHEGGGRHVYGKPLALLSFVMFNCINVIHHAYEMVTSIKFRRDERVEMQRSNDKRTQRVSMKVADGMLMVSHLLYSVLLCLLVSQFCYL